MSTSKIRPIAFYLPQFYPTPENDEWWEPGFTEWTNVVRAKPLFRGHYQPRIPRDLGFYDLRVPETREKQAQLAREAGIEGFCYWHYWFGNGKRLLSDVFKEVVETGKPDFPFCLCWANHSWYAKTWNPNVPDRLLIEQTYPGGEDYTAHFYAMLPAFRDPRYMRMEDGKVIFGVFAGYDMPDIGLFFDTWNQLARENGLSGFYFFGLAQGQTHLKEIRRLGFDAIVYDCLLDTIDKYRKNWLWNQVVPRLIYYLHYVHKCSYDQYVEDSVNLLYREHDTIPCIDPDFDHTPRSGYGARTLFGSTPEKWGGFVECIKNMILNRLDSSNLLFIKAWNEWAEGNYLEPDCKWGKRYIEVMSKVLG